MQCHHLLLLKHYRYIHVHFVYYYRFPYGFWEGNIRHKLSTLLCFWNKSFLPISPVLYLHLGTAFRILLLQNTSQLISLNRKTVENLTRVDFISNILFKKMCYQKAMSPVPNCLGVGGNAENVRVCLQVSSPMRTCPTWAQTHTQDLAMEKSPDLKTFELLIFQLN